MSCGITGMQHCFTDKGCVMTLMNKKGCVMISMNEGCVMISQITMNTQGMILDDTHCG